MPTSIMWYAPPHRVSTLRCEGTIVWPETWLELGFGFGLSLGLGLGWGQLTMRCAPTACSVRHSAAHTSASLLCA